MSDTCETVKIKADNDQGFTIINKSDMAKDDVLFKESKSDAPKKMGVKELKAALTEAGVEIPKGAKQSDLQKLFDDLKSDPE